MKPSCVLFVVLLSASASACSSSGSAVTTSSSSAAASVGTETSSGPTADAMSPTAPLPPGVLTSSEHSDEWKIRNALSAAPAVIAEKATVQDWPADLRSGNVSGGRVLRHGTNGWTCMPDTPGKPQHDPVCMDETMMKWMSATFAGRKPNIDRVGLSYMLLGEAGADQQDISAAKPPPGKDWYYVGPHVMVVLPDVCRDALEDVNQDISKNEAYVTALKSSSPLWVIPVAKVGERIKAYLPNEAQAPETR
jgi:hypothetical protein